MKLLSLKKINRINSGIKAIAEVLLDDGKIIKDIFIIKGDDGYYIALKNKLLNKKNLTDNFLKTLEKTILDDYNKKREEE